MELDLHWEQYVTLDAMDGSRYILITEPPITHRHGTQQMMRHLKLQEFSLEVGRSWQQILSIGHSVRSLLYVRGYCQPLVTGQQYFGTIHQVLYRKFRWTHTVRMVWTTPMRAAPSIVTNV